MFLREIREYRFPVRDLELCLVLAFLVLALPGTRVIDSVRILAAAAALLGCGLPGLAQSPGQTRTQASAPAVSRSLRFLAQRSLGSVKNPATLLMHARAQDAALELRQQVPDMSAAVPWTAIGPQQISTRAYGLVTGRVTSIAVDPHDTTGNTVYVGTTGGGVWKSTNAAGSPGAASFTPLTDSIPAYTQVSTVSLSIGALSVQPGGTGVILAGTGDPNDALDSYYGSGILRSDNGGNTWSLISRSNDALNGGFRNFSFLGLGFSGFAWSTTNPNTVVAALSDSIEGDIVNASADGYSTTGLYYSTDSGQTWYLATIEDPDNQIIQAPDHQLFSSGNPATSVVWNPVRKRFYAAIRFHGYYESPDGITWTRLANQPGTTLTLQQCPSNAGLPASTSCPIYRGTIAAQPVTGDLFTLTIDLNNQDQGLYRDVCSAVGGSCASPTVQFQQKIGSAALDASATDHTVPQGDYDLTLTAVPYLQDTLLFAGTVDVYRASMANSFTWRNTTNVSTCAAAYVPPSNHAIDATFGGGTQSISGLMYFGNDGGLWRTTDDVNQTQPACSSDDASHYQNLNTGLGSLAEMTDFSTDPTDATTLFAGFGGLGTAASASGQSAWTQVLDGEGTHTAIDPASPQNWYATSGPGVSIDLCSDGAACTPHDFAPLVQSSQVGNDGGQLLLPAAWILDPQDTAKLIVGTCRVWRGSGSGGAALYPLSPMLDGDQQPSCSGNAQIRSLAASGGPVTGPERIYAGMAGVFDGGAPFTGAGGGAPGHVYLSQVSSQATTPASWSDLYNQPVSNMPNGRQSFNPGGFDISSLYIDTHDTTGQTVYVTVEGFDDNGIGGPTVYRSTDAGLHWFSIVNNLPDAPANSIVVDPNDAGTVYVALDTGVYVTRNVVSCTDITQNCWTPLGTGLPKTPVTALKVFQYSQTAVLQAATYGRGLWQIPLATAGLSQTTAVFIGPQSLTFAGQPLQTAGPPQGLTITNTGSALLNITGITATGDFTEQNSCVSNPISPGSNCTLQITFTPTALGPRTGTLTAFANIPGGQITASLTGTGDPAPTIVLTPSSLNYGSILDGTASRVQYVTISNTGSTLATLQTPTITGDFAISANTCGPSLQPNYGCTVGITFTPTASGARGGIFSITDGVGTQTTQLSGTGLAPATDTLSQHTLVFTPLTIGQVSPPQEITLTNSGGEALTEIAVATTGAFSAVNNCGPILAAAQSCGITVRYVPKNVGMETGTLTLTDVLGHLQTVSLSGSGIAPAGFASAEPQQLNFGSQGLNHPSTPQAITLTNNGTVPLTSLSYATSGPFAIQSDRSAACGSSLAVGASCGIYIAFTPTQSGPVEGSLVISSGLNAPITALLSGTGEDFSLTAVGNPTVVITSGQSASWQFQLLPLPGSSGAINFTCSGAPANALCSVNPASITLQSGVTGSISMTVSTGAVAAASGSPDGPRFRQSSSGAARMALALACMIPFALVPGRQRRILLIGLTAAGLAFLPTACGVSSSGGSSALTQSSPASRSTASGTYTLTLTGTVPGVQHTATVTLIVQ